MTTTLTDKIAEIEAFERTPTGAALKKYRGLIQVAVLADEDDGQSPRNWTAVREAESALMAAIKALQEAQETFLTRLEANFAWQIIDGVKTKITVEPGSIPDGIECRDETIRQQDTRIKELSLRKRPIAWMRQCEGGGAAFCSNQEDGDPPEDEGWIALYRRGPA